MCATRVGNPQICVVDAITFNHRTHGWEGSDAGAASVDVRLDGRVVDVARRRCGAGGAVFGVSGRGRAVADHVQAYAHDLNDWFVYLGGHEANWRSVHGRDVAEFVAWLRFTRHLRIVNIGHHDASPHAVSRVRGPTSSKES
jgi:hypothetical protein